MYRPLVCSRYSWNGHTPTTISTITCWKSNSCARMFAMSTGSMAVAAIARRDRLFVQCSFVRRRKSMIWKSEIADGVVKRVGNRGPREEYRRKDGWKWEQIEDNGEQMIYLSRSFVRRIVWASVRALHSSFHLRSHPLSLYPPPFLRELVSPLRPPPTPL